MACDCRNLLVASLEQILEHQKKSYFLKLKLNKYLKFNYISKMHLHHITGSGQHIPLWRGWGTAGNGHMNENHDLTMEDWERNIQMVFLNTVLYYQKILVLLFLNEQFNTTLWWYSFVPNKIVSIIIDFIWYLQGTKLA